MALSPRDCSPHGAVRMARRALPRPALRRFGRLLPGITARPSKLNRVLPPGPRAARTYRPPGAGPCPESYRHVPAAFGAPSAVGWRDGGGRAAAGGSDRRQRRPLVGPGSGTGLLAGGRVGTRVSRGSVRCVSPLEANRALPARTAAPIRLLQLTAGLGLVLFPPQFLEWPTCS